MTYPRPTAEQLDTFARRGWLVVEDAIPDAQLDELENHCERLIEEKETLAFAWAWDAKETMAERSFRIVQASPAKVWDVIAAQPYRKWLTEFGAHGARPSATICRRSAAAARVTTMRGGYA